MDHFVFWFLIGWIGGSVFVGVHAYKRGRNGFAWFLPSLIISPLITWLVLLSLSKKASDTVTAITAQNQMLFDALTPEAKARVIEAQKERETKKQAEMLAYYKHRRLAVWIVLAFIVVIWIFNAMSANAQPFYGDPYDGARAAQWQYGPPNFYMPPLGWIYGPYTYQDPTGVVRVNVGADGLNVRVVPNGPIVASLANGVPVVPLQQDGNWVLVAPGCFLMPTYTWSITGGGVPLSVCGW